MKNSKGSGNRGVKEAPKPYLTKRATARAAKRGFIEAAKETIEVMGFNVIAKNGWVVKVDKDGNIIERISKIEDYHIDNHTLLD